MKYRSTRGEVSGLGFVDALLTGLAPDGGLLIPETVPDVRDRLSSWRNLSFTALAKEVVALYVDDIPRSRLDELIDSAYASFDHEDVVGYVSLGEIHLLELFHGPTLAFKDIALQLLGRLFEHALAERGQRLNILGATSGDTGSAAIAGVRGQPNIDIFIMYPDARVSRLQELQMTTIPDANVHCVAVDGSFDDCQRLMKDTFADLELKQNLHLGAVNSVNWARVLAQVVYYGYASLKGDGPVSFCVPTGNFGNVFAGYLARRMGFPIDRLLVATNDNDILARFFATGEYARGAVHHTLSPAMDIQVASNFERFLFYHFNEDSDRLCAFMRQFQETGAASVPSPPGQEVFAATAVNAEETLACMRRVHEAHGYVLDPHTAVGVAAAEHFRGQVAGPVVCIATAHPAKFPEAVAQAVPGVPVTHPALEALRERPERKHHLPAELPALKRYLVEMAGS